MTQEEKIEIKTSRKTKEEYKNKICPKCNKKIIGYPALSRADNKTWICSNCGTKEAIEIFIRSQKNKVEE